MMRVVQRMMVIVVGAIALGIAGGSSANTGSVVFLFPDFFPTFTGVGTIEVFPPLDDDPDHPGCTFWRDDATGALYFFAGIDAFAEGDRVLVHGEVCTICLVYNVCGVPATALINADAMAVPPPPKPGGKPGLGVMG